MAKQKRQFLGALDSIAAVAAPVVQEAKEQATARYSAPSRQGKQLVGGHLPPQYKRTLKMLSAQTDTSQEELLRRALEMLFTAQRMEMQ